MKTADVTHEDKFYTVKAMNFFTANRLLLKTIMTIVPVLTGAATKMKKGASTTELLAEVMEVLNADILEKVTKELLFDVRVDNKELDLEELDYELALELLVAAVMLNYSSLGKKLAKLMPAKEAEAPETLEVLEVQ